MNTIFCVFLSTLVLGVNCVVVQLKNGVVEGITTKTKEGRLVNRFLGIPYAKPPINELRFKPPEPVEPWNGTLDATQPPPICVQRFVSAVGQEDCLYLNVLVPNALFNSSRKLPVVVGIHGGYFQHGSYKDYDGDYFMEKDVVFVSINYRLGLLGFLAVNGRLLTNDNNEISGNFGLKDQTMALKWVKENIGQFGGDPNQVTLIGGSAGAASAHFHMFSPLSKGLFQKAVILSGSAFAPWSHFPTGFKVKLPFIGLGLRLDQVVAALFLKKANCSTKNKLECLQKIPTEEFTKPGGLQDTLAFMPTIELKVREGLAFLPEEPNASNYQTMVPWMTGITSGEGALVLSLLLRRGAFLTKLMNTRKDFFLSMANLYMLTAKESDIPMISQAVNNYYFGEEDIGLETALHATDMITDSAWTYPLVKTVLSGPSKQYLYLYDHRGSFSLQDWANLTIDLGVCHADEIPLLFRYEDRESRRSLEDRKVADTLLKYVINFAISGDPNKHSREKLWQPMRTQDENFEYLHIKSNGVVMEKGMYNERYKLWKNLPTGW